MREIIPLRDRSREDVIDALKTIQQVCHEYMGDCGYTADVNEHCPFVIDGVCIFEVLAPDNWDIKDPDEWKAFNR